MNFTQKWQTLLCENTAKMFKYTLDIVDIELSDDPDVVDVNIFTDWVIAQWNKINFLKLFQECGMSLSDYEKALLDGWSEFTSESKLNHFDDDDDAIDQLKLNLWHELVLDKVEA